MAEEQISDFLTLPPREYPSDDDSINPIQPALDTLFSQFSQRHQAPSPVTSSGLLDVRLPHENVPVTRRHEPSIDLRALDYTLDYDTHLMCPICHVPFIDPVVLDCDHTFCASCLDEFRDGATNSARTQCPSCRTFVLSAPKKASRLISNMCNDIKVGCPNENCSRVLARGYMDHHISKDCLEQLLHCPDAGCERKTKRKNYIPSQCIHDTHLQCDCGAIIELGRGEWLKHKDEDCPNTRIACERCGEQIPANDHFNESRKHDCQAHLEETTCPGRDFGCSDQVDADVLDEHVSACPIARLAPFLSRQSRLLTSLSEQLSQTKLRNEVLETGLERIEGLVTHQLRSKRSNLQSSEPEEIEEIERDHIPGTASFNHRELLLPAHVRDLTPSPTFSHTQPATFPNPFHSPATRSTAAPTSHQHLLSLHDSLRNSITSLETDVHQLHINITELDARSSMQIMNETLRLKEELAHTNAALFSTRSQVQWLLNKERMSMSMNPNLIRRQSSIDQTVPGQQNHTAGNSTTVTQPGTDTIEPPSTTTAGIGEASGGGVSGGVSSSNQSSTATSPIFGMASTTSTRRPSIRRHSGGSQERVKL